RGEPMKALRTFASYLLVAVIVLLAAVLSIRVVGSDVTKSFAGFFHGAFGSEYGISEVLVRATPLMLAGLGVSIGFSSGFFNIGAEGQIYMGAAAATVVGLLLPGLPIGILLPLAILASFAAGGFWSAVPGLLKARWGLSEVINTIMFNYIAINIVGILVRTVLKDPNYPLPMSPEPSAGMTLPTLLEGTRLHAGLLIALAAAFLVHLLMRKTRIGFTMRVVGLNPRAGRVAGISVRANVLVASLLSGGLAGVAGAVEVAGIHHKLLEGISPGFGYLAIIVSLLGKNNPAGIVAAALGIAILQVGSMSMQRQAGVPTSISWIIMGLLVLLILARTTFFRFLLKDTGEVRS
ncbi:MAG: ABC transporter permease, partial [Spirochaetia bacterium]